MHINGVVSLWERRVDSEREPAGIDLRVEPAAGVDGVERGRGHLDAGPGALHKNIARNMSLAKHAQAQRLAPQLREGLENNVFAHVKVGASQQGGNARHSLIVFLRWNIIRSHAVELRGGDPRWIPNNEQRRGRVWPGNVGQVAGEYVGVRHRAIVARYLHIVGINVDPIPHRHRVSLLGRPQKRAPPARGFQHPNRPMLRQRQHLQAAARQCQRGLKIAEFVVGHTATVIPRLPTSSRG